MTRIGFSYIKRYLAPLIGFRTTLAMDRPQMSEHIKCTRYLANAASLMGLSPTILNVPEILCEEDKTGWEEFRHKHGIDKNVQLPSVWATAGASAKEAERTLIFFGHYDVVSAFGKNWRTDPFTLAEDHVNVYGRGVIDMKGGLAAQLAAINAFNNFHEMALPPGARLAFLVNPLEEQEGHFGAKAAFDLLIGKREIDPRNKNFVIVGESTELNVLTIRRASYTFEMDINITRPDLSSTDEAIFHGAKSHAGNFNIFDFRQHKQEHALYEMARAFAEGNLAGNPIWIEVGQPDSLSITPNLYNVTPAIAKLYKARDSRRNQQLERILKFLYEISCCSNWQEDTGTGVSLNSYFRNIENNLYILGTNIRILTDNTTRVEETFRNGATKAGLPDSKLIIGKLTFDQRGSQLSKIAGRIVKAVTGQEPDILYMGKGCSDGQFAAEKGLQVTEIGPIGENEHGSNESATIESLIQTANIYYELIKYLLLDKAI